MEMAAIGFPSPAAFIAHVYFRFSQQKRIFYFINTVFPDLLAVTPAVMATISSASSIVE